MYETAEQCGSEGDADRTHAGERGQDRVEQLRDQPRIQLHSFHDRTHAERDPHEEESVPGNLVDVLSLKHADARQEESCAHHQGDIGAVDLVVWFSHPQGKCDEEEDKRFPLSCGYWAEIIQALLDACLLYTSDAADDLHCVDLDGGRIIK